MYLGVWGGVMGGNIGYLGRIWTYLGGIRRVFGRWLGGIWGYLDASGRYLGVVGRYLGGLRTEKRGGRCVCEVSDGYLGVSRGVSRGVSGGYLGGLCSKNVEVGERARFDRTQGKTRLLAFCFFLLERRRAMNARKTEDTYGA